MTVRLYTSTDGKHVAARVKWPGFAPDWLEAQSMEEMDEKVDTYVENLRQAAHRKAVAPVSRKAGKVIKDYARARVALCEG